MYLPQVSGTGWEILELTGETFLRDDLVSLKIEIALADYSGGWEEEIVNADTEVTTRRGTRVLRAEGLRKHYDTPQGVVAAVDGVNLTVNRGEFVVVMGPSGCGKTTLLSMLGGLIRPTAGRVFLEDMELAAATETEITEVRRYRLGFVFQSYYLLEHMTALENVLFPLQFSEMNSKEQTERAKTLLDMVGLGDRLEHFPRQLSGGEKQRVAVARALANEPALLLADELTGNLDAESTEAVLSILQDLNERLNQTIVSVSHDMAVRDYATRALHLKAGQIDRREDELG